MALRNRTNPAGVFGEPEPTKKPTARVSDIATLPQIRGEVDEESVMGLAATIKRHGLLNPITVRKATPEDGVDRPLVVIAGHRRFKACEILFREHRGEFAAIWINLQDVDIPMEVQILENIQREDIKGIQLAHAYADLMEKNDLSVEEIADRLGKKRTTVATTLSLLKLTEEVQALIRDGKLEQSAGFALAKLRDDEPRQIKLARKAAESGLSTREIQRLISEPAPGHKPKTPTPRRPSKARAIETLLEQTTGLTCKVRANPTSITVKFSGACSNEDILAKLEALGRVSASI
jgi:ParB family transcriptional regulator, chromosome partitioning protein